MKETIVIGSVPYLNAKPLVAHLHGVESFEGAPVRVVEEVPSRLADMLARREIAAAIVSSATLHEDHGLCALSAGAVVSDGPILSVRLMSRVPLPEIRRLALDASSRTSVVLCRLLLEAVHGVRPVPVSLPPDLAVMLDRADAALIIGDPAMRAAQARDRGEIDGICEDVDLGELWRTYTGLPFVYALWVAPTDEDPDRLTRLLSGAAAWGVPRREEIAARAAPLIGLPEDLCRRYVRENVRYHLGPREWDGLRRFLSEATDRGFLPGRDRPLECGVSRAENGSARQKRI